MEIKSSRKNFDAILLVCVFCLGFGGLLILYAASSQFASNWTGQIDYYFWKQGQWFLAGLLCMFISIYLPLDLLKKISLPAMLLSIFLLLLVFIPGLGHSVSSTAHSFQRWLRLGPITFQPSEFAKISLVLYVSHVITKHGLLSNAYDLKKLTLPVTMLALQLLLIVAEPQYGTTICMISVIVMMIFVSGFPVIRLFLIFLSLLPLLVILIVFWEYRFERIYVWLDPWKYKYSGGYQLVTSFRAFSDGAWFGTELASGFAHRYLTYGHTDFILALFSEDFGIVGIVALFGMYLCFLWRSFFLLNQVAEPYGYVLGYGIVIMLFSQILLNLGVVSGILPTTGVSLPFISYGGSSLIVTLILCGLLLNVTSSKSMNSSPQLVDTNLVTQGENGL